MGKVESLEFRWQYGPFGNVASHSVRFANFGARGWIPAVNAFRCENGVRVCVDLAGVDKSQIDLRVEPQRIVIRGARECPEPRICEKRPRQILAMEIDYGPFERELVLPEPIDVERVTAEQEKGFLWIDLPFP